VISALEVLVRMANTDGSEYGVTLLVQGRIVSGILTPNKRFGIWVEELAKSAATGKTVLPVTNPPRVTSDEAQAIREDWQQFERTVLEQHQGQQAAAILDHPYDQCCLREAKVFGTMAVFGSAPVTGEYPFLLVDMTAISAFTYGLYERTIGDSSPSPNQ
jgi:hypothetical protein